MTTDYAEQHRDKVLNKYRKVMFEQDFPADAPMRFTNSQWHYHNDGLQSLVHRDGKEFFLGREVVVDPCAPSHSISETVAYSRRKWRESLAPAKHPWDLDYVYAHGEPFKRFDPTAALSAHHFSARNIRSDGTLRPIPESESRANVLAYADQVNRENIKLREELEQLTDLYNRFASTTERRVKDLEADYERARDSATSILRALNDSEAFAKELLIRVNDAEERIARLSKALRT